MTTATALSSTTRTDGTIAYYRTVTAFLDGGQPGTFGHIAQTIIEARPDGTFVKDFTITYRDGRQHHTRVFLDTDTALGLIFGLVCDYSDMEAGLKDGDDCGTLPRVLRKKR